MNRSFITYLITVISALGLAACGGGGGSDGDSGSSGGSTGQSGLSLAITDAPVDDALQVVVSFSSVSIKPSEGEAITFEFEPASSIDLLTLQGNASQILLDAVDVPSGDYEWIRLGVNADDCNASDPESFIELADGSIEPLFVPSGAQSGLKLNSGFSLATGGLGDFVIDFDLRKSVVKPNGRNCHYLKPSMRLVDNLVAGGIVGTVEADLLFDEGCSDSSAVYVYTGADAAVGDEGSANPPISSAAVALNEDSGMYEYDAAFLAPGDYTVAFTCQAAADDAEADDEINFVGAATVNVEAGVETQHDFTVPAPTTGEVSGTVATELVTAEGCSEASAVYVYAGVDAATGELGTETAPDTVAPVSFSESTQSYEYRASELTAGDYTLAFTCDAATDTAEAEEGITLSDPASVEVMAGEETVHDFGAPAVEPPPAEV